MWMLVVSTGLGWQTTKGLGPTLNGIVNPISLRSQTHTAGLGSSSIYAKQLQQLQKKQKKRKRGRVETHSHSRRGIRQSFRIGSVYDIPRRKIQRRNINCVGSFSLEDIQEIEKTQCDNLAGFVEPNTEGGYTIQVVPFHSGT